MTTATTPSATSPAARDTTTSNSSAATPSIAAFPAPPDVAVQIYNRATMTTMIGKLTQGGQSMNDVLAWAQDELEGFTR